LLDWEKTRRNLMGDAEMRGAPGDELLEEMHRKAWGLQGQEVAVGRFLGPFRDGKLQNMTPGTPEYMAALQTQV
jgi:hypothetical protein